MFSKKGFSLIASTLFALSMFAPNAFSCSGPPPQPPQPWIVDAGLVELYPCGPKYNMYWIIYHDFTTFPTPAGVNCGCGQNLTNSIVAIVGAKLIDQATGQPCPGFDFCTHPGVSNSASKISGGGNFGGFIANISQSIPGGLVCDLMVCVLCKPGTTYATLANELETSGMIVMGQVNNKGVFNDPDHYAETRLSKSGRAYVVISEQPSANNLPGVMTIDSKSDADQ